MSCHLVLVRHGQSQSNREQRFAGWRDVALTELGRQQAQAAGERLAAEELMFDVICTSMLRRAIETADLLMQSLGGTAPPPQRHWRLNERHTGQMQGMTKADAKQAFGRELARTYRRSWDVGPPLVEPGSPDDPRSDPHYAGCDGELPRGESMSDVVTRIEPWIQGELLPRLRRGESVLLVGHGQSLRALARRFEGMDGPELPAWKLGSAVPRCYQLDADLRTVDVRVLGDDEAAPGE